MLLLLHIVLGFMGSASHLEVQRQAAISSHFNCWLSPSTGFGPYKQTLVSQLQSVKLPCLDAVNSNAVVDAAPLAACSTSQQGTFSAEQVPSIEVSINGQASSLHSSQTDVKHIKHGVLGRPSSCMLC